MFKLIAIKPLDGCKTYLRKCLVENVMYYLCNDYTIFDGKNGSYSISYAHKFIKPLYDDFFATRTLSKNEPRINVCAVVGKNGDGKSSLIELAIRAFNNCIANSNIDFEGYGIEGVAVEIFLSNR